MPLTKAQKALMREKQRQIRKMEATIARNDTPPEHQLFLRKQIAKAKAYLETKETEDGE